tara:strand:+ start:518 stop:757 length:240 start_codon:yes stop_codon:yes gene_type:complete
MDVPQWFTSPIVEATAKITLVLGMKERIKTKYTTDWEDSVCAVVNVIKCTCKLITFLMMGHNIEKNITKAQKRYQVINY